MKPGPIALNLGLNCSSNNGCKTLVQQLPRLIYLLPSLHQRSDNSFLECIIATLHDCKIGNPNRACRLTTHLTSKRKPILHQSGLHLA